MYGKKQNYWSLVTEMATVRIVKKTNILILSVCLSVYLYIPDSLVFIFLSGKLMGVFLDTNPAD